MPPLSSRPKRSGPREGKLAGSGQNYKMESRKMRRKHACHATNGSAARIDECVSRMMSTTCPAFGEHVATPSARAHRYLLLSAIGKALEESGSVTLDAGDCKAIAKRKMTLEKGHCGTAAGGVEPMVIWSRPPPGRRHRIARQLQRRDILLKAERSLDKAFALTPARRTCLADAIAASG